MAALSAEEREEFVALLLKREYPPPFVGGARNYYHELLRRQRHGRFVVLTGIGGVDDAAFDAAQPYRIERRRYARLIRLRGYPGFAVHLLRWLADTIRILHGKRGVLLLGQMEWFAAFGPIVRSLIGAPYVIFLVGEELTKLAATRTIASRWLRLLTRRSLAGASAVIVISRFTREIALGFGASAERLFVVHPGVDAERFRPDPAKINSADPPRLLSVGRLVERKGIDTALAAFRELVESFPGIVYEIVGEGPDRSRLEALAQDLGVAESVHFLGRIAAAELPLVYRRADVFLLPNRELPNADTEGFGMVFLEAAASGVPAIAGRAGGVGDSVLHGETGLQVDPASPPAVAEAVTRLLRDGATWRRMREQAHARAAQEFSWDRAAAELTSILESVRAEGAG